MDRCRENSANDLTVLSFPAVFTWKDSFGLSVSGDEHFYVIRCDVEDSYYYPVGEQDACRNCVYAMMKEASEAGCLNHLKFLYIPERELGWMEDLGFRISCEPNTSEYIYSSASLALLDNNAGTNFRVKIRHFSRDNSWHARPLSFPEDNELLRRRVLEWDNTAPFVPDGEHLAVQAASQAPVQIGLSGVYLETGRGEWAFLLGYQSTPRIYDMSFVKYSPDLSRNVVPVCISEMAKLVSGTFPYINLEDDLGIPGLRNMKKLYHPLFLLGSYSACL